MPLDSETKAFIQALPKTETHLHVEGCLPWELLHGLFPDEFAENPHFWAKDFRYQTFEEFERTLIEHAIRWFDSPERYHEGAKVIFEKHLEQNVRYVETSFHAGIMELLKIPGEEVLEAIRTAAPEGLDVHVFLGISRNAYTPFLGPVLEDALESWENLAGIDLHGLETLPMEDWTPDFWAKAKANGRKLKAHAGEFGPAENVREAIEKLNVRRIQHGVRAVEDPSVIELIKEVDATLDICPISNLKLKVVPSMAEHPVRRFFDEGIRCTLNTDDTFSFGNRLNDEYEALAEHLSFTRSELAQLARNGFELADVEPSVRQDANRVIDQLLAQG
ncbi:MAG: adenosine deaminase [Opitutae bacterium]|nr:adenosine deaminase [Opitutae bacterium]|tara:strand:+ start:1744 stop:2742 length:999 start_codon:yes stop_codon:yes gene_type:complete